MSVRTCQLCGKPLGRMRNDGDFCSREHRNQFRLRKGMDRLEEANKVANLMRRRESPRQIPPAQLLASAPVEYRGALEPAHFPIHAVETKFPPFMPVLARVRIASGPERFSNPLSELYRRSAPSSDRSASPASLSVMARPSNMPVVGVVTAMRPAVGVARAQLTSILRRVAATGETWRECGAQLRISRPPAVRAAHFALEAPGAGSLESARRPRPLAAGERQAGATDSRAPRNISFQKRSPLARPRKGHQSSIDALAGSPRKEPSPPPALDVEVTPRLRAIPRHEAAVRLPRLRVSQSKPGTLQHEAVPMQPAAYETITPAMPRLVPVGWETERQVGGPKLRRISFVERALSHKHPVPVSVVCDFAREHRPAEVRFTHEDSSFDLAPIPLRGSLGPSASAQAEPLEEHFDAGMDEWTGDLTDWRLDAAGARPSGLALFRPTLALSDYEFEFFTRIEARATTFVFRAANASNYHKVTIAMVESGRYELRRCAVIGGVEEAASAAPLPGVLRPGAAFTVKTRAWQNDFTIWLDGELAARWTDGRLPTGGIGFMAARDDRARVYWVRLSPVEGNSPAGLNRKIRSIQ